MSTTTIRFELKEDGVLVDATSVAISAAGVIRKDTGAIVVAGGTALTRTATGTYEHTFTDPADNLVYSYSLGWVDADGNEFGPIEMPDLAGGSDAAIAAYNTLASARATALSLGLSRITAAADAALTAALLMAAMDIDSPGFRFQGRKYDTSQEREFPRVDGVVPQDVLIAEAIQAESILRGDRNQVVQAMANGIASQSTGSVSVSFRADAQPQPLCERAMRLMSRYRLRGGALL